MLVLFLCNKKVLKCSEMPGRICKENSHRNAAAGWQICEREGMKMEQTYYLISDAAKQVQVESHVLRYWEEELGLPIKRNDLGHRFYTEEDIARFVSIKNLKEKGLQLKAIKMVLQDEDSFDKELAEDAERNSAKSGKKEPANESRHAKEEFRKEGRNTEGRYGEEKGKKIISVITKTDMEPDNKADKVLRMQMLLRQMIAEAVRNNNEELCENLRDSIVKELDYQFRTLEEREEERAVVRDKKEEEHYQKIDELLRGCFKQKKEKKVKNRKLFRAEK